MKNLFLSLCYSSLFAIGFAQSVTVNFNQQEKKFCLENAYIKRVIKIESEKHAFYTSSYILKKTDLECSRDGSAEFTFSIDGKSVNGSAEKGCFDYVSHKQSVGADKSVTLTILLKGIANSPAENIQAELNYIIYPDAAAIHKWISIVNNQKKEIRISDLQWEKVMIDPWGGVGANVYTCYGNYCLKPPYHGGKDDPAIIVTGEKASIIVGNEAPGIMKYTAISTFANNEIAVGLNPSDHDYPFARYLKSGSTFTSPRGFIILTSPGHHRILAEEELAPFVRKHLGVKIFGQKETPLFMYNTWVPLRWEIDEKIIRDIADSLVGTGVEYMSLDFGWQDNMGDWNSDPGKFPGGLKAVCDYIRSKGMKPGFWISLTAVETKSKIYKAHPEYFVRDQEGRITDVHGGIPGTDKNATADILSPWYDYMKERIFKLVRETQSKYIKIDLSAIKSAYVTPAWNSGSYKISEEYKGREEFLYLAYDRLQNFFDELSKEFPDLIIDCTFELWGDWHTIDYALIRHADADWISNFDTRSPDGQRKVRQLAYNRGAVIPTAAMLIGNMQMDKPGYQNSFLSNMASTPILLGDPRKLTHEQKQWHLQYYSWLKSMQSKYDIMKYYQVADVFEYPGENNWDGFVRFNPEKGGGILCVFRNGSPEITRHFALPWLNKEKTYRITSVDGIITGTFKGEFLMEKGFEITINNKNSGVAFEIAEK